MNKIKNTIIIIIIFIFSMFQCISFSTVARESNQALVDVIISSDKTRIDPGEDITFNIYLIGTGNITYDYLLIYMDAGIYVDELIIMNQEVTNGLADKEGMVQLYENIAPRTKEWIPNIYFERELIPFWGAIEPKEGTILPPIMLKLSTISNVKSGDHDLKIIYVYKDGNETWNQASDSIKFHITTTAEMYEIPLIAFGQFIFPFIITFAAVFIGYLLAVKYDRRKKTGEKIETINRTKQIISSELYRIKNDINNCLKEADEALKQNKVYNPNIDLPTDCKDSAIFSGNFSLLEGELQEQISHIYAVIKRAEEMKTIAFEIFIRVQEHADNKNVVPKLEKIFFQEFKKFYGQLELLRDDISKILKLLPKPKK